jgi:hypothetical protein
MRLPASIAMGAVLAAAGACTPASNDAIDVRAPAPSERASTDRVPAAAAGKISADQVGKVSPVPAFQGGGKDWSIEIQAVGGMRHSVRLSTGDDVQTGTAVYQPAADKQQILLTGTLYATQNDRALRITLTRGECRDAAGRAHRHRVRIDVAGATSLQGCGDLAMY